MSVAVIHFQLKPTRHSNPSMNQVQAFSFSVSWSQGIFPYVISVSVGRDASERVVDDMGVWATCS